MWLQELKAVITETADMHAVAQGHVPIKLLLQGGLHAIATGGSFCKHIGMGKRIRSVRQCCWLAVSWP